MLGPRRRAAPLALAAIVALTASFPLAPMARAARRLDLPLYAPESGQLAVPAYAAHKLVLELAPTAPGTAAAARPAALDALAARFGVVTLEPLFAGATAPPAGSKLPDLTRYFVVHLGPGALLDDALDAYAATPGVVAAEPVGIFPVSYTPNDPFHSNQYALGQVSGHDSRVYDAWDVFKGDTTVAVAILDTGVEYAHPDLGGVAAPWTAGNIWTNWAEMAGVPGVDDDGDGEIDDFRGWDFVNGVVGAAGEDTNTPDNQPTDFDGHGTMCAGIASAWTDNGVGIAGVGFRTKIMPVRVGWQNGVGQGVVDMSFCAQGIHYAVTKGAAVINCSWGSSNFGGMQAAVDEALARGVLVVDAAGNGGSSLPTNYLSARGDCVDVASVDSADVLAGDSNFGPWIDVAAAGVGIFSTSSAAHVPGYATGSGTSFAAPLVSGAAALFQGYRRSLGLSPYNAERLRLRLTDTGDNVDAFNPGSEGQLATRLNVRRLLTDPPTSWVDHASGAFMATPLVADLTGAGRDAIIAGGSDGVLLGLGAADGDTLVGWPVALSTAIHSSPAAWDVDLDGHPDAVVGTADGKLWAVKGNGTIAAGWPKQFAGDITSGPAVGDVAGSAGLECVIATDQGNVYVIDHTGAVLPGWPKSFAQGAYDTAALADLDGDGRADIVLGSRDSMLYAWKGNGTVLPGWPVKLGGGIDSSPAIGDVDHDGQPDIVVGGLDHKVYAFHANGTPLAGWPVTVAGAVHSSPALADLVGNDGLLEVAIGCDGGTVYVIQGNGTFAPGWPEATGGDVLGGIAVGNVDTDPALEVVAGARDGRLYAWHANGLSLVGWPRAYAGEITCTPTLGDPDKDGQLEIVIADEGEAVRAIDMGPGSYVAARLPWPTFHRDTLRRGSVTNVVTAVSPSPVGTVALKLAGAPNPARGAVRFALTRGGGAAGDRVHLAVYDVRGRRVRALELAAPEATNVAWTWDGRDEAGHALPAGLYFARARWDREEATARIVRLP